MRKLVRISALVCLLITAAVAQNTTTITGTKVQNVDGSKITGSICFAATDANNNPISFQVGGGGQVSRFQKCAPVSAGTIGTLAVPNPANTNPAGILYHVTVVTGNTTPIDYKLVSFSGGSWNFDNYAPSPGPVIPPAGGTISGNLAVSGNLTVTGTFTAGTLLASAFDHTPSLCSTGQAPTGITAAGNVTGCAAIGGPGTVTSFSAGSLSPLFTTSVATPTSTPALTFTLSNAGAFSLFGNNTSGSAAPSFSSNAHLGGTLAVDGVATVASLISNGNITASSSTGSFGALTSSGNITTTGSGNIVSGNDVTASSGTISGNLVNAITGFKINSAAPTGHYARGNGTNYVDNTIQVADVPTLNQSTSGNAATATTATTATNCTNCRATMNITLVAGLDTGAPGTYPALGAGTGSTAAPVNTYYQWTPDAAITVTRVQFRTDRAPVNCPRYAEVGFTDGTNKASITMTNGGTSGDSGAISQAYSAGTPLKLAMINGENSGSCDTIAGRTYFTVQYKMQ